MPKKTKIEPEELEAFRKAVPGVKPLPQRKIRLKPAIAPITTPRYEDEPEDFLEVTDLHEVGSEDYIGYKQSGISNKMLRKLRKGQYNVEAYLDLHGMSVEAAKKATVNFLKSTLEAQYRVVLIIHGKGRKTEMPILKNKLNLWLRDIPSVLAFCSAASHHGSRGAIYVLLKRSRGGWIG